MNAMLCDSAGDSYQAPSDAFVVSVLFFSGTEMATEQRTCLTNALTSKKFFDVKKHFDVKKLFLVDVNKLFDVKKMFDVKKRLMDLQQILRWILRQLLHRNLQRNCRQNIFTSDVGGHFVDKSFN